MAAARLTGALCAAGLALAAMPAQPVAQAPATDSDTAIIPMPPAPIGNTVGRPTPGPGCVSLELAAARRSFPPNRIALYSSNGGWLGDVVVAPACPPIVARARVYVADKNKQWGKICARDGPVNTHLWVQDTRCDVVGVVDARDFQGEPPDPIAPGLERRQPQAPAGDAAGDGAGGPAADEAPPDGG